MKEETRGQHVGLSNSPSKFVMSSYIGCYDSGFYLAVIASNISTWNSSAINTSKDSTYVVN